MSRIRFTSGVRLLSVALVALLLAACGGEKPDEAAKSWRATLQMTAEKWADNAVPARFVRSTCDSAQKALKENPQAAPVLAAAVKLRDAAERGDRNAARQVAAELRKQ